MAASDARRFVKEVSGIAAGCLRAVKKAEKWAKQSEYDLRLDEDDLDALIYELEDLSSSEGSRSNGAMLTIVRASVASDLMNILGDDIDLPEPMPSKILDYSGELHEAAGEGREELGDFVRTELGAYFWAAIAGILGKDSDYLPSSVVSRFYEILEDLWGPSVTLAYDAVDRAIRRGLKRGASDPLTRAYGAAFSDLEDAIARALRHAKYEELKWSDISWGIRRAMRKLGHRKPLQDTFYVPWGSVRT